MRKGNDSSEFQTASNPLDWWDGYPDLRQRHGEHWLDNFLRVRVFRLIASAKGLTEIAEELGLSVKTVSTYRTRILEKMEMGSNAELMQYAIRQGLVEVGP